MINQNDVNNPNGMLNWGFLFVKDGQSSETAVQPVVLSKTSLSLTEGGGGEYTGISIQSVSAAITDNDISAGPLSTSGLSINGIPGSSITVSSGAALSLNFSFAISPYPSCPGCIAPILVGIVGSPAPLRR